VPSSQIEAARPVEEVFESVKAVFTSKDEKVKCRCCGLRRFFQKRLWFVRK
jgi:DNA-directed RNA polymerase subunit RPC12/RpoP